MRHLRLQWTNLTNTESVPEKQELHRNKIDEKVKVTLIILGSSYDTYAARKKA
jgi:hypothetical protein